MLPGIPCKPSKSEKLCFIKYCENLGIGTPAPTFNNKLSFEIVGSILSNFLHL